MAGFVVLERSGGHWVFDEREHLAAHEPCRAYRVAGTGYLNHLDHAATDADLHPPTGPCRHDVVGTGHVTGVNHDLDPVALHEFDYTELVCD
jgi:hypothetical protein